MAILTLLYCNIERDLLIIIPYYFLILIISWNGIHYKTICARLRRLNRISEILPVLCTYKDIPVLPVWINTCKCVSRLCIMQFFFFWDVCTDQGVICVRNRSLKWFTPGFLFYILKNSRMRKMSKFLQTSKSVLLDGYDANLGDKGILPA